jgi:hypothetical protein
MKPGDITQTITHYLAKNFEKLPGTMPNDRYFLVRGTTISEYSRADSKLTIGTAIDVLADVIEKKQFFGWHIPESIDQATNCNNAEIVLLNDGDKVSGNFIVKLSEIGLFVAVERVQPKKYIDILRTPEGFKQSAGLLSVEGDLEKIASTIYVSKY